MDCGEEVQSYRGVSGYSMGISYFTSSITIQASDQCLPVVFSSGLPLVFLHRLLDVKMVSSQSPAERFYTDELCRLLYYTPSATVVRLSTTNFLIAYITSWVLYLSGASEDPRMLLPAWVSIAMVNPLFDVIDRKSLLRSLQTLTLLYHVTHRSINIKRETSAALGVFSFASFLSLCTLLFQLHLTRENDPAVPLFSILQILWLHILQSADFIRVLWH